MPLIMDFICKFSWMRKVMWQNYPTVFIRGKIVDRLPRPLASTPASRAAIVAPRPSFDNPLDSDFHRPE